MSVVAVSVAMLGNLLHLTVFHLLNNQKEITVVIIKCTILYRIRCLNFFWFSICS